MLIKKEMINQIRNESQTDLNDFIGSKLQVCTEFQIMPTHKSLQNFIRNEIDGYINYLVNNFIVYSYANFEYRISKIFKFLFPESDKEYLLQCLTLEIDKYLKKTI